MAWFESDDLAAVREHTVLFTKYLFWALAVAFAVLIASGYISLVQSWLVFLETARHVLGFPRTPTGPDWWLCSGLAAAVAVPAAVAGIIYARYQKHWERRLRAVWQTDTPAHAKFHPIEQIASEHGARLRIEYLRALCQTSAWCDATIPDPGSDSEGYRRAAEAMLRNLEKDVRKRAGPGQRGGRC